MSIGDAGPVCEVDAEHEQCRGWRNVVLEGAAKVSRGGADYGFCPGCGVVVVEVVEVVWIVKYSYSAQMSVGPLTHWLVKFLSLFNVSWPSCPCRLYSPSIFPSLD